ncbi:uncharacterized protein LOC135225710 isoform X2 [Macrobrachium nipponense]|uniref:uncharacterized protein LOC135225710 isoform X2 n=1 Tax=Macrobrachium nipponense TaxID=159736 RepID=UPI0030C8839A
MLGLRWVTVGLLVATAAACVSGSGTGDLLEETDDGGTENPWIRGDTSVAVPAESQQISVVAAPDLQASASGYGKHHKGHKGYKGGYHDKKSYKGKKGHKDEKGHKKKHKGDYGKDHKKGYHDKGGKHYKGHEDKHKYYGDEHKGKKGKKGHHYGSKGHHNKGHKDKGFKNVYHKEEYHHQKKYYDDQDKKKYHNKYDDYDSYFKANKGKDYKGKEYKGQTVDKYARNIDNQEHIEEPLLIARVRSALDKINDISSNAKDESHGETDLPVTQEPEEYFGGVMRYAGRALLDRSSKGRARFQRSKFYNEQCQVHDLRMIRRYLMYCVKHSGDVGPPEEGAPPCSEEDLGKIKKYLNFCQIPFLAKASRGDKRQYKKLKVIAKKLDMRNNIIEDEEVYQESEYAAEVCNVEDLRQMKIYIEDCYSRKEPLSGRPFCELANYEKSLEYLSTCEIFFLSKASRRDKRQYSRLLSMASAMIQEVDKTESSSEKEHSQPECLIEDLREAQRYVNGCKKLLKGGKSKRKYGAKVCQREHLLKINSYLLGCEDFFLGDASARDRSQYSNLVLTSEVLGVEPGEQSESQEEERVDDNIAQCEIKDLRRIPRYLRSCDQSESCEIDQLSKVYEFLVSCETFFLQTASERDRSKYNELTIKAEILSTRENIEQWREETVEEKKLNAQCKFKDLRRIPRYLRSCDQFKSCEIDQLSKVYEFLVSCETFFLQTASERDRSKYNELTIKAEMLSTRENIEQWREETVEEKKRIESICKIHVLRKIPKYLRACYKSRDCKLKRLLKLQKFLGLCEDFFTIAASPKDRGKYAKYFRWSTEIVDKGRYREVSKKEEVHRQDRGMRCDLEDLRKVPKYLSDCTKTKTCKKKQLSKVFRFLFICEIPFTSTASHRDKKKYRKLMNVSEKLKLNKPVTIKPVKRRRESTPTTCATRDLRKIPRYLSRCATSNKCRPRQLAKVHKYMTSCKRTFTKKASRSDQRKYAKLTALSKRILHKKEPRLSHKQHRRERKVSPRRQKTRESIHHPKCKVTDLRKVKKYLTRCTAKTTSRGGRRQAQRGNVCGKGKLNKMKKFLLSCKRDFLRRASRSDMKQYHKLIVISKKGVKQQGRRKGKQAAASKRKVCKVGDLRKVPKYLKKCSDAIRRNLRKGSKITVCKKENIIKLRKYLDDCQSTFLKSASKKDKRQYKSLAALSNKLSRLIQRQSDKRTDKKEIYPCDKDSLRKLEKHVKHCQAKIKRDKKRAGAYRRRKQERARYMRTKRRYRKQRSYPRKENERCRVWERRARRKYRQGGKYHDKYGKKGDHEKGKYHDDHKGHKGHYDHKSHYGDKSSYGKKGGYKGDYGHDDYGHDDHDHHGYGHDDHHGHGYGHGDYHGHGYMMYPAFAPRMPVYCFRRDYCAPFIPPPVYSFPFPYF